jgi:hypothetical protein
VKADAPVRFPLDELKSENRLARADANAGFFKYFALGGLLESLTDFDTATRDCPKAFGRRFSSPNQQDAVILEDNRAHRDPWLIRARSRASLTHGIHSFRLLPTVLRPT